MVGVKMTECGGREDNGKLKEMVVMHQVKVILLVLCSTVIFFLLFHWVLSVIHYSLVPHCHFKIATNLFRQSIKITNNCLFIFPFFKQGQCTANINRI